MFTQFVSHIITKRPGGVIILGILCVFTGFFGLLTPLHKPMLYFGILHTGFSAYILHIVPNLLGLYVGYGLLKPLRHVWYLYPVLASVSIIGLGLNLAHQSKIWELYLLLHSRAESIPRLVAFTVETHYLLITIYALTAIYVYLHKFYFWGDQEL